MRLEKYLNEKYFASFTNPVGDYFSVFKNPSKKEMIEASKEGPGVIALNPYSEIRFVANDKDKSLYVWGAATATHHSILVKVLNINPKNENLFGGVLRKSGNKWNIEAPSYISFTKDKKFIHNKFKWIEKYNINLSSFTKLNEEYVGRTHSTEVFKNPSLKEIILFEAIRFTADLRKKDIYVWDGRFNTHDTIWKKVLIPEVLVPKKIYINKDILSNFLHGFAVKSGSEFKMINTDTFRLDLVGGNIYEYKKRIKWIKE
jgi:hypothetical protein